MIVVSNTSPLNYLILIDAAEVLPQLFDTIHIPAAVQAELLDEATPDAVRAWIDRPPSWLRVEEVTPRSDAQLDALHRGEREAILLAEDLGADLLLLDERMGRLLAVERGLQVAGTLGVLNDAGAQHLIDVTEAVDRLRKTTFRAAPPLYRWLLEEHRRRQP